jgi:hypothetical protein
MKTGAELRTEDLVEQWALTKYIPSTQRAKTAKHISQAMDLSLSEASKLVEDEVDRRTRRVHDWIRDLSGPDGFTNNVLIEVMDSEGCGVRIAREMIYDALGYTLIR